MLLYASEHTWIDLEDGLARVGLSDFAQAELGDVAYVELPAAGARLDRGGVACTLESLKSSSEIYAPVSGTVVAVNEALLTEDGCGLVNRDPLGDGWLFQVRLDDPAECADLMPPEEYLSYVRGGPTT
jgi:glycine cleavage system H protein